MADPLPPSSGHDAPGLDAPGGIGLSGGRAALAPNRYPACVPPTQALLTGPDVSVYDRSYPDQERWAFTYIRRSIGLQLDAASDRNMAAARALGVARVGWYHFITAGADPVAQADFFLHHAAGADFLVSDCEGATSDDQALAFNSRVVAAGLPIVEYVQASRRAGARGPVSGQIIALWGPPSPPQGALGWQAWSSDARYPDGRPIPPPVWVPAPHVGDWDMLLQPDALDAIIAKHKGSAVGSASQPFNLVPLTCHRRVALRKGVVLYRQDRQTPYTTLSQDVSLGYVMAADATWAIVADGDAACYVKRSDMGAITSRDVTVGN